MLHGFKVQTRRYQAISSTWVQLLYNTQKFWCRTFGTWLLDVSWVSITAKQTSKCSRKYPKSYPTRVPNSDNRCPEHPPSSLPAQILLSTLIATLLQVSPPPTSNPILLQTTLKRLPPRRLSALRRPLPIPLDLPHSLPRLLLLQRLGCFLFLEIAPEKEQFLAESGEGLGVGVEVFGIEFEQEFCVAVGDIDGHCRFS